MSADIIKRKRNIKLFDGEKYNIWKFRVRALIVEEDALQVLDNEKPNKVSEEKWQKRERIAKGSIIQHLSDSMIGFATEQDTARQIFKQLDEIYERKSLATQLAVEKKLLSFKYKGNSSLVKYFVEFDEMVDELLAAAAILNETIIIARLLLTLPNSYDSVVTAIKTLSDENLSLAFVKIRLLDYEIKLRNESEDTIGKVLQAVTQQTDKNRKHSLNGSQRKWKNSKSVRGKQNYHREPNQKHSNAKHISNNNYNNKNTTIAEEEITRRKIATITSVILNNYKCGDNISNKLTILLDSGATDHIVNQLDVFSNTMDLTQPLKISIAKKEATIDHGNSINAGK